MFFGAVQLVVLGILGEYVGRLFQEATLGAATRVAQPAPAAGVAEAAEAVVPAGVAEAAEAVVPAGVAEAAEAVVPAGAAGTGRRCRGRLDSSNRRRGDD